jgi:RimJ/RimL family protein N-acetyltransferase
MNLKAPEAIETSRLILRRLHVENVEAVFERFASDPEVTRFVGWPRHRTLADTKTFFTFSEEQWNRWPAGPYLIWSRNDNMLLGSTGLAFETPYRASTGYVLAKDSWGKGYATEALAAMVKLTRSLDVRRLYALCHTEHHASWRVLEKVGFLREGVLRQYLEFPNLLPYRPTDVFCYALIL